MDEWLDILGDKLPIIDLHQFTNIQSALDYLILEIDKLYINNEIGGRIIHGIGIGKLKQAVWDYLKTEKNIVEFKLDFSGGATIFRFKF